MSALEGPCSWLLNQITRDTACPVRDQDPGIWWSPACRTQTCWGHSGPSRTKDISKGIRHESLSQYCSSHTGGSSHRPLPPALSEPRSLSPLQPHVLRSLKALPSGSVCSHSQPPWITARDVKDHCPHLASVCLACSIHPVTFN